jgi:hypothetical protein
MPATDATGTGAGWSWAPPLDDQIDVAWLASSKTEIARASATRATVTFERSGPRTWVDMIRLLPPAGPSPAALGGGCFGPASERWRDRLRIDCGREIRQEPQVAW